MSAKTRDAPASAMMIEFNCWEIWLMGWVKLLDSCKKAAIAPSVRPPPFNAIAPPTMARMTYCRLPMLFMAGMRILAYLFARRAEPASLSFKRSKPSFAFSSWQKTLTTF